MFFCFQTTNHDQNNITCQMKQSQILQTKKQMTTQGINQNQFQLGQFEETNHLIVIPQSIARTPSLGKISSSNKKIDQQNFSSNKFKNALQQKCQQKNENLIQRSEGQNKFQNKKGYDPKQMIFSKLLQKNNESISQKNKLSTNQRQKQNLRTNPNHNQKQKIQIPSKSFYHKHQNVQKLMNLYKEKTQKQLKQCTFNPKINLNKINNSSLNSQKNIKLSENEANKFFQDQLEYYKKTQNKIQQMRAMIQAEKQKQNTFKPIISAQTAQLTERRTRTNVYERLFAQNKQNAQQKQKQLENKKQISVKSSSTKKNSSRKTISLISSRKNQIKEYNPQMQNTIRNEDENNQTNRKSNNKLNQCNSLKKISQFQRQNSQSIINKMKNRFAKLSNQTQENQNSNTKERYFQKPNIKQNSLKKLQSNQKETKKEFKQLEQLHLLDCRQLIKKKENYQMQLKNKKLSTNSHLSKQNSIRNKLQDQNNTNRLNSLPQKENQRKLCKTSQKNLKIALQKFIKQFITIAKILNLKQTIDYDQTLRLMKTMNFIQNLDQIDYDQPTKNKFNQIWQLLEGFNKGYILLFNLLKILCAIMGYHKPSIIEQSISKVQQVVQYSNQKYQNAQTLILSQKDSKNIKNDFSHFYYVRFKLGQSDYLRRNSNQNYFSFKPSISKVTQDYAEKYREKILLQAEKLISQGSIQFYVPQNGMIDHNNLLILDQKIKQFKLQNKRKQVQKQRIKLEDESMAQRSYSHHSVSESDQISRRDLSNTAQNNNSFSRTSHKHDQSRSKDQIFLELYQKGLKQRSNRRDRSKQQIEFQDSKIQLTFKPKINNKSVSQFNCSKDSQQSNNIHQNIPNFTKDVFRMRKGNQNQNNQNEKVPVLFLNVAMEGNQNVKIPVFQTDTFLGLTQKIRVLMNIQNGQEQRKKLEIILKNQIIPVINKSGLKNLHHSLIFND